MSDHDGIRHRELERRRVEPNYWYNKSSDLRASAGAIWTSMKSEIGDKIVQQLELGEGFSMQAACHQIFPMLCGLSLELMYKAICVAKGLEPRETHDLMELASTAGVDVDAETRSFLMLFTSAIFWSGKYPVPSLRRPEEYERVLDLYQDALMDVVSTTGTLTLRRGNGKMSWDTFDAIWRKASSIFSEVRSSRYVVE